MPMGHAGGRLRLEHSFFYKCTESFSRTVSAQRIPGVFAEELLSSVFAC